MITASVMKELIKQIDGCPMGGPTSAVIAHIYMCQVFDKYLHVRDLPDCSTKIKGHFNDKCQYFIQEVSINFPLSQ